MSKAHEFINRSYSALQEETGIDRAVWSKWFNGKRSPTMTSFYKLADLASVDLWDLVEAFSDRRRKVCEARDLSNNLRQK